jgi:MFS family permease
VRIFLIFLFGYVLSQFFRSFLAVIAPELASELALDPQALGNLQALWIAGFSIMQIPVGLALDSAGPRRSVSVLMLAAVAGSILFAMAQTALMLNAAMVLIGIGCSAIYMGALYMFARTEAPERFALLSSWLIGIGSAGNLLAATPLAWAATLIGWRGAMLAMAAATAASAATLFLLIRDPPRLVTRANTEGFFKGVGSILAIRALWPLLPLTAVGYAIILAERGLWAGPYLTEVHGLEPVARGNALLIMAIAMSLGAMIYGPLDRWLNTRKWIVAAGSLAGAACLATLAAFDVSLTQSVMLIALLGAFCMNYAVLMAHGRAFVPDHLLGRGITLLNLLFIGGAGILQPLSGWLMTAQQGAGPVQAYAMLHGAFAVLLLAAVIVYLFSSDAPPGR